MSMLSSINSCTLGCSSCGVYLSLGSFSFSGLPCRVERGHHVPESEPRQDFVQQATVVSSVRDAVQTTALRQ